MGQREYIYAGLVCLVAAIFISGKAGERGGQEEYQATSVPYVGDLNEDGRPDVVVRSKTGRIEVFLQQEDGTYIRLDKSQELEKKVIEEAKGTK